jgi:Holliday junction resolvase RusA-like endonuclease
LSLQQKFTHPEQGGHLTFYIPVPKTWKKYKKEQMHFQLHTQKPDWDNLAKAWGDSLMTEDKGIADLRVTKRWVNQEKGWIEFICYPPEYRSQDNLM